LCRVKHTLPSHPTSALASDLRALLLCSVQSFFEADVASIEEPPNRTPAARDSPLAHRRNHFVQRQIRLLGNQTQQKPRMFLQRRCAAATRLCRNASGPLKALGPKHHHTGADPIAFGRLPPRRACRDVSDHADTQVHGIRPRHSLPPSPNQRGQTRSLTSAWESLRFNPSGICSKRRIECID
jgi:hypothetical protein